uniref:Cytochrome P450 CYP94D108 n=1 Tax=Paris polyphylla TaxID=49666 RepID=94D18_PARPY|nr:RecName: Full=Cytochrome P450 CYP94D108; Short=PpCYP94D108 [Paris polyphylla]QDS03629.1 cytochrome P450 CYP94D108 [Paris polyphylla]
MDPPSLLSLALLLLAAAAAAAFVLFPRRRSPEKKPSSGNPGSLSELIKNGHRILDWMVEILAASPTNTVATYMGVVTANPANVEHMLKTKFENYPKGDRFVTLLEDFLGRGIFNSDGDHWKLQRKTASLEFNTKTIRTFVMENVRVSVVDRLIPIFARAAASGETIDLQETLERFAFDNVCKVSFNEDTGRLSGDDTMEGREFARAFEQASELIVGRYKHPFLLSWKLMRFFNIGDERRLKEKIATVHRFATSVIRRRKSAASLGDDLLSRFIAEADYPDEFLRDIIISFVLAGRDTTSATLTWFFWLASTRPEVLARVEAEVNAVRRKNGTCAGVMFTLEEVREMDFLHAALSEALRLYPPVPLQTRACHESDEFPDGTKVRPGTTVMYNSYAMGRMKSIWGEDYAEFRPERWLDKGGGFQPRSPFRFPVFHAGPRMCLGKEMAYIQMKAVAASVVERFEVVVMDKEKVREKDYTMILRVKGGLPVRLKEKSVAAG